MIPFFFVIVWKLIQDSRYDREPIFQFALLLFADLLPFNTVMAVRYLQQLINQNYKNQIYSTESCLKHRASTQWIFDSPFYADFFHSWFSFQVLNLHRFVVNLQECIDLKKIMHNKFRVPILHELIDRFEHFYYCDKIANKNGCVFLISMQIKLKLLGIFSKQRLLILISNMK